MPRPKHAPEARRDHHIGVRFAAPEYEKIRADAEKIGVTVSAYARAKILQGYLHIPKYTKLDVQALNQFSRMGGLVKKSTPRAAARTAKKRRPFGRHAQRRRNHSARRRTGITGII